MGLASLGADIIYLKNLEENYYIIIRKLNIIIYFSFFNANKFLLVLLLLLINIVSLIRWVRISNYNNLRL